MQWLSGGQSLDQSQALASGFGKAAPLDRAYQDLVQTLSQPPLADRKTMEQLRQQLRPDYRQADMSALIDSASVGSIKQRILTYRDLALANRARSK
jgi:hypothetical protein